MTLLDRTEPRERPGLLRRLTGRSDGVAALACSGWTEDYLGPTMGEGAARDAMEGVRTTAVQAALGGSDPKRKAAAEALETLGTAAAKALDSAKIAGHRAAKLGEGLASLAGRDERDAELARWRGLYQQERERRESIEAAQAASTDGAGGAA